MPTGCSHPHGRKCRQRIDARHALKQGCASWPSAAATCICRRPPHRTLSDLRHACRTRAAEWSLFQTLPQTYSSWRGTSPADSTACSASPTCVAVWCGAEQVVSRARRRHAPSPPLDASSTPACLLLVLIHRRAVDVAVSGLERRRHRSPHLRHVHMGAIKGGSGAGMCSTAGTGRWASAPRPAPPSKCPTRLRGCGCRR